MANQSKVKERTTPGPRPGGKISITAANQKQVAPLVSVYCGPEPDRAYQEWVVLDSRGKGAAISEWFWLRQVTPALLVACEQALVELSRLGVNQRMPVMVNLKAVITKAEES